MKARYTIQPWSDRAHATEVRYGRSSELWL
jgi:hypothetical protein